MQIDGIRLCCWREREGGRFAFPILFLNFHILTYPFIWYLRFFYYCGAVLLLLSLLF